MKVCFIAGTLGCGGAERQLLFMLRALKNEGVQTKVLCLTQGEKYEKEIKELGVDIEWVGRVHNRLYRLWKVAVLVKKFRPDILQSTHFYTNLYSAMAGKLLGIQEIGAIRNDVTSEISANQGFGRYLLKLPGHLIANSKLGLERALGQGILPEKIDLLPNAVEPIGRRSAPILEKQGLNIIFVGRLVPQKRPELFVKIAEQILEEFPQEKLTFQIVGGGPLLTSLERFVKDRKIPQKQLIFLGELSEMADAYANADILLLTSEYEGTPNVVLEAMAQGVPVVSTSVGGVPEILSEETGILVDPSDFDGLVEATKRLIFDPELRATLGRRAKAYVTENHSQKEIQTRLVGIYAKLLAAPND